MDEPTDCLRESPKNYHPTPSEVIHAKLIRHRRKDLDMSLGEVAEAVGVDVVIYSAWERAVAPAPDDEAWDKIVEVLGL